MLMFYDSKNTLKNIYKIHNKIFPYKCNFKSHWSIEKDQSLSLFC